MEKVAAADRQIVVDSLPPTDAVTRACHAQGARGLGGLQAACGSYDSQAGGTLP
eukprot:CAMPEP_0206587918 /NCGR_PEP_ID=MMETSP0325_2-20121206/37948_1 /ASSEMBLY_ACC=CAM_ASM_000347 /TAXON_ID=2866 /ORGANISM="Crypthecodinium cohnii, Strain Seligo" /LENGTH=53 /DNA_ID=CAMNT_0054096047 /DNA_START=167 /DNA_END=324 /DNA_ORIENTATION=-